jgi:hypothetical protein
MQPDAPMLRLSYIYTEAIIYIYIHMDTNNHPKEQKKNTCSAASPDRYTAASPDRSEIYLVLDFCSFMMKADLGEAG